MNKTCRSKVQNDHKSTTPAFLAALNACQLFSNVSILISFFSKKYDNNLEN